MENQRETGGEAIEKKETKPKKKFKIDKKMILCFAAGVVLCAIVGTAVLFGVNPELLKGTVSYNDIYLTSKSQVEDKLAAADRPVILLTTLKDKYYDYTTDRFLRTALEFQKDYGKYADIYVLRVEDIFDVPSRAGAEKLIATEGGSVVAYKSVTYSVTEADIVNFARSCGVKWTEHAATRSDPTVYAMYYASAGFVSRHIGALDMNDDNLGEIRLFAGKNMPNNYQLCAGQSVSGFCYLPVIYPQEPFTLDSFTYPDLTDSAPADNLSYVMCNYGVYPGELYNVEITSIGKLAYYEMKDMPLYDWSFVSEIKLLKNINTEIYGKMLLPCDGRALKMSDYYMLFELIGNAYAADEAVPQGFFRIPNLSGLSPIEGAEYYIVAEGLYPYAPIPTN